MTVRTLIELGHMIFNVFVLYFSNTLVKINYRKGMGIKGLEYDFFFPTSCYYWLRRGRPNRYLPAQT